jgi:PEGA domain-containing protein
VIGLLTWAIIVREKPPAARGSSPSTRWAETGTPSAVGAVGTTERHTTAPEPAWAETPIPAVPRPSLPVVAASDARTERRVAPLAAPPVDPGLSTPRQAGASELNSSRPASVPSPAGAQVTRAIPEEGAEPRLAAAPPASRFRGDLMVESVPEHARVFVDHQAVGSTPVTIRQLPAGSHVVRVEADGYEIWSAAIRVVADQQTRVTAQLRQSTRD